MTQKRRARLGIRPRRGSPTVESSYSYMTPAQFHSDIPGTFSIRTLLNYFVKPAPPLGSNQEVSRRLTKNDYFDPAEELKVSLGSPKKSYKFFQRPNSVYNILRYEIFKEYHLERSLVFTLWPDHLSELAHELALSLSKDECVTHFSEFALRDVSGVTDLFDLKRTLSMMMNFLDVFTKKRKSVSVYIDADLVEQLSISSLIVSQTYVLRRHVMEGTRWLSFSFLLRGCLNDANDVPSIVLFGIWVVICKSSNFMLNNTEAMIAIFDHFFDCISRPAISQYVQKDRLDLQHTDEFKAIARVWTLIKLSETEINILNGHGCSQHKFPTLRETIQPNKALIDHLFSKSLKDFTSLYSRFHVILYIGTRYFGRFEAAPVRELIYSYLKLHQAVNELDSEISQSLEVNICHGKDISLLPAEYFDLLANMIFLKHFYTRFMLFVKLEKRNFPSMRFAHYVSNLICLFNWIFYLADIKEVPLDRIISSIFDRAYFVDIQLFYCCCGLQAIFVALLKHFTASDTAHLTVDINFLVKVVKSSMNRALKSMKSSRYSGVPIISQMLRIIDGVKTYAEEKTDRVETFEDFIADILNFLSDQVWESFVMIWFGNHNVCHTHLGLIWRIASFLLTNGSDPIYVHSGFYLDTNFFRQFEHLVDLYRFTADEVDQYMEHVVDAAGLKEGL